MAIGDKKPVVMEADRAVAGGIATLGADGKLSDAQIPGLEKLGAAPAGYGLGEVSQSIFTKMSQVDAFKAGGTRGVYLTDGSNIGNSTYGILVCKATDRNYTQTFSYYYSLYGGLVELKRVCTNSVDWQPWECVNPPMLAGQEYRTTERYNGKPVYVKLLEVNPLPNNTVKYVNFCPIAELDSVVEVRGFIPDTLGHYKPVSTYPPAFTYSKQLAFEYSSGENYGVVAVYTNYDGTGTIGQALVKYTKTTN